MELRKFRNRYDLELIQASHENIILGNLVWDPFFGKPKFTSGKGMSNHIANAYLDAEIITQDEWSQYLDELKQVKEIEAHFADAVIDVDMNLVASLENPQLGKVSNNFTLKKIKKCTFGDLKARVMSNLLRIKTDDFLEKLKRNKWDLYDGNIRHVYLITELYYGSIQLVIEENLQNELEGAIKRAELTVENKTRLGNSVEYSFSHGNVPFAMRIEKMRDFTG